MIKTGETKTAANTKKEARAATPKLTCIVTGQTRFTNQEYLDTKIPIGGSIERFVKHYICSDAVKMLRAGSTVQEVRSKMKLGSELPVPNENMMKIAMELNGKRVKKEKAPKAPKAAKTETAKKETAAATA
jgi:hypothetical protein